MKEFAAALNKVQKALSSAKKSSLNPHFRSKYADLESVWDACREPLTNNGFSVLQTLYSNEEGKPGLKTTLLHESGQMFVSDALLPITKGGPQDMGSCIKYMRRYSLAALVGVTDGEDDDAELAEGRRNYTTETTKAPVYVSPSVAGTSTSYSPEPPPRPPSNFTPNRYPLSEKQVNRLYAIAKSGKWSPKMTDLYVKENYKTSPKDLSKKDYEDVCAFFQETPFNDEYAKTLEGKAPAESIMDQFEKAKSSYKDHTAPNGFDGLEEIPF